MRRLAALTGDGLWAEAVPLRRFATPDEIVALAAVLSSPLAAFVSGARIDVDSGLSAGGCGLLNHALAGAGRD